MIKNRKMDHIGLAVTDLNAAAKWYMDVLGFERIGAFVAPDGTPVNFLKSGDLVYEIYQPAGGVAAPGKIDHFSCRHFINHFHLMSSCYRIKPGKCCCS